MALNKVLKIGFLIFSFLVLPLVAKAQATPPPTPPKEEEIHIEFTLIGFDIAPGSAEEKALQAMAQAAGGTYLSVQPGKGNLLSSAILQGAGVRQPPSTRTPLVLALAPFATVSKIDISRSEPAYLKLPLAKIPKSEELQEAGRLLSHEMAAALAREGRFVVLPEQVLKASAEEWTQEAGALGAHVVLTGSITSAEFVGSVLGRKRYSLTLHLSLISTKTGDPIWNEDRTKEERVLISTGAKTFLEMIPPLAQEAAQALSASKQKIAASLTQKNP